jgi:ABC-type multidrug transport system ATPase subunit
MDDSVAAHHQIAPVKNVLEFDSLELSFSDKTILSAVYMCCCTGEVVGLLGRNGSGKSSLMKIVCGALHPQNKHVRINGKALFDNYVRNRVIAYLPQNDLIPKYLSLDAAFRAYGISRDWIKTHAPALIEFVNLKPAELSGGYLRIAEVLMILKSNAQFCILDEPFSGLSPVHIEKIVSFIQEAKKEKGIIITDHLHRHVTALSARLYMLANGRTHEIKNREQLVSLGYLNEV